MPTIQYKFGGQTFKSKVTNAFLQRPKDQQNSILKSQLMAKYEDRIAPHTGERGILDYLAALEKPAQALKVGLKESALGGDLFRAAGGVDLTPEEGFWEGASRGWSGEEEVRTQDFLPDDMNPILKGVLGFAGDVATDPLTYVGAGVIRGIGSTIARATPRSVAKKLTAAKNTMFEKELPIGDGIGMKDLARWFNAPVGKGRQVKGIYGTAQNHLRRMEKEMAEELPKLNKFFQARATTLGVSASHVHRAFRDTMERGTGTSISLQYQRDLGKEGEKLLKQWEDRTNEWHELEQAFGLKYDPIKEKGYFPRLLTRPGREFIEQRDKDLIEGIDAFGQPIYKAGYRMSRKVDPDKTISEINMGRQADLGARTPNPLDRPYEYQFFQEDPSIALGLRWSQHNKSMQRKWFIDEITDGYRTVGRQYAPEMWTPEFIRSFPRNGVTWEQFMKQQPVKSELSVGKWVRKGTDDTWEARFLNEDKLRDPLNRDLDKFTWKQIDNPDDFQKVKGLPDHTPSVEELDQAWTTSFLEQLNLRGLGRFQRSMLDDKQIASLSKQYPAAAKVADNAKDAFKRDNTEVFLAPKDVRRQIEDTLDLMSGSVVGEKKLRNFIKVYDEIQNSWKAWTLGVRPAYHTRNALGNVLNAYTITGLGENIPEAISTFKDAAKLQYYGRFNGSSTLRNETVNNLKGINVRLGDELAPNIDDALWKNEFHNTGYTMEEIVENAKIRGVTAGHYADDIVRDQVKAQEAAAGMISPLARALGPDNPAVRMGFAFGGTIEGNARYAVFLNTLAQIKKNPSKWKWTAPDGSKVALDDVGKGHWSTRVVDDPRGGKSQYQVPMTRDEAIFDIASQEVKKSLFDYRDVSKFERNVLKRAMPFYTWTRKNLPAQLKHLVLNPERAEKLHLAKEQFEHETGDLNYSDYGKFWGERVPIFLGKENQGVVQAFTALNVVPMADLQRMFRPGHLLTEMVTPLIKEPLEQIFNYDTFRKKPIVAVSNLEMKDYLGIALPTRLWKLAQIIVPLTEINRLNPLNVFGERSKDPATGRIEITEAFGGLGARRESNPIDAPQISRWLRFFSGASVYDINLRQQQYFKKKNLMKDMSELKGKIKWHAANKRTRRMEALLEVLEEVERQERTDPFNRR